MKFLSAVLGIFGAITASNLALAASPLTVESAWARATPSVAKTGAVFFTLRNSGSADDVLLGATSDAAVKAELHETLDDGGIIRMRALPNVTIPAGGSVDFKPGGKHLMLIDLKGPLVKGQTLKVIFTFKAAGAQTVTVNIDDGPAIGGMHGMPSQH